MIQLCTFLNFLLIPFRLFLKTQTKSPRIAQSKTGSGSGSDDINIEPGSTKAAKNVPTATATNLKRKRGVEKSSPAKTRPVIMIRQVVPGMLGAKYAPATSPAPRASARDHTPAQVDASSMKKPHRPIAMRRVVVDKPLQKDVAHSRPAEPVVALDVPGEQEQGKSASKRSNEDEDSRAVKKDIALLSPPVVPKETIQSPQIIDDGTALEPQNPMPAPAEDDAESLIMVRRTTRSRKSVLPANDVFTAPTTRPLHSRRKAPAPRSDGDGFSGLSSVALKALTSSNTVRNQQNFVSLATEVIRKDGFRPESPIMKVRTISQRQADERSKGRSERAHRRARRSDDGLSDTEGFSSDRGDTSMVDGGGDWEEDDESKHRKHRRGPGEDEDYETPARPEKPLKRPRFEDEKEDVQEKKRVKWDRGLYSEIYLDEIEIRPGKRPTEHIIKKGCLAPTAKVWSDLFYIFARKYKYNVIYRLFVWTLWAISSTPTRR